jgi:hypothetical protein
MVIEEKIKLSSIGVGVVRVYGIPTYVNPPPANGASEYVNTKI